ncbi:MAG: hypothetical protein IAG13_33370 [Deltaproteobacteria bacterium]|nr:hypothetical protein [Nannocystaceae bacterium]
MSSAIGCSIESAPPEPSAAEDASASQEYGMRVRVFDLVVGEGTDLGVLDTWEVSIVEGPRRANDGATIVTIRSTRALADRLVPMGFRVLDHDPARAPFRAGDLAAKPSVQLGPCDFEPVESEQFPPYDAHPGAFRDGLEQEMLAMHDGSSINVTSIATTYEGREVQAVRVGPIEGDVKSDTPTVYVFAAYHAREWATTAMTMEMLRATVDAALTSSDDPLRVALYDASVVFVPVVNPDGYEYSRFSYREQRKNRRPVGCSDLYEGVDLNRNHAFAWGTAADSISTNPCDDRNIGDAPNWNGAQFEASEAESSGVERMLRGEVFDGKAAALFSYHSYADIGIYPMGLKLDTDGDGPRCLSSDNCMNPDYMTYRRLWGDTENPKSFSEALIPYPMDMLNNVIYTTSGDVMAQGAYSDPRVMGVSHEITSRDVGFYIECDPNRDAIIADLVAQNLAILTDVLEAAPGLVDTSASTAYATNEMGTWAPGMWVREASDGFDHDSARPRFVKPVWRGAGVTPPVESTIAGNTYELAPARSATQYEAYMLDMAETDDPWCLPCEIVTTSKGYEGIGDGAPDCSGCIDLRDPSRLNHDGWDLVDTADDVWWEPVGGGGGDAVLEIGGGAAPAGASHCNLMFSTRWSTGSGGEMYLERDGASGVDTVQRWPNPYPFYELRDQERLRTHMIEANSELASGSIPKFRFVVPAGASVPAMRVYEPVIYCRIGGLP